VDYDRLTRSKDLRQIAEITETFRENKIKILLPGQVLDYTDIESEFLSDLFSILSKREKPKILERMQRGQEESARKGQWQGARYAKYGYRYDKGLKKLVIVPEEAAVVRRVFEMFVRGTSAYKIAQVLNEEGVKPRSGRAFYDQFLYRLLTWPGYMGTYRWKGVECENAIEPLVDKGTFEAAQLKAQHWPRYGKRGRRGHYLLSGIALCPECGSHMSAGITPWGKYKKRRYFCSQARRFLTHTVHTIDADWADREVLTFVLANLPERIYELAREAYHDEESSRRQELDRLNEQLERIQAKKSKAVQLYLEDELDKSLLKGEIQKLEGEEERLKADAAKLRAEVRPDSLPFLTLDMQTIYDLEPPDRKLFLSYMVKKVVLYKHEVKVEMRFDTSLSCNLNTIHP
jgi:site-specific DNA recombinase